MSVPAFELGGLHHLALVCKDMEKTVDFYTNKLGMKLNKGFDLDGGIGQHFFFDMGDGQELAFFWFRDVIELTHATRNQRGGNRGSFPTMMLGFLERQ